MGKDLKDAVVASTDRMDRIAQGQSIRHDRDDKYRFSLVMPGDFQEYLKKAAYNASEPGRMISINQYIVDLVRYDIEHGGIIDYHKGADNGRK